MKSRILSISSSYSKFENILPDELIQTQLKEELELARDELKQIIKEDQENIKNLCLQQNKTILFDEFRKPDYIIKMAFYTENDTYDHLLFNYAHWTMSLVTLEILTYNAINMSTELKTYYTDYTNGDRTKQKTTFINFVRAYQDFFGFLINIRSTIEQYYDSYVRTCNEIDPNNKEQTIYAYKSDSDHSQLLAAVKELLLHGNRGRLAGFAVLRSAIEIFITRKLFDPKNSQKYQNNVIKFPAKDIPTIRSICNRIDKLNLGSYFKTDSVMRLYDWQSIVAHRGLLSEEYLTWFVYYHIANEIITSFNNNSEQYGDQILDELQSVGLIKVV
jgi:hypothetical protein